MENINEVILVPDVAKRKVPLLIYPFTKAELSAGYMAMQ